MSARGLAAFALAAALHMVLIAGYAAHERTGCRIRVAFENHESCCRWVTRQHPRIDLPDRPTPLEEVTLDPEPRDDWRCRVAPLEFEAPPVDALEVRGVDFAPDYDFMTWFHRNHPRRGPGCD